MPEATLHLGDCLEVMKSFPDNYVSAIVTDPPYGINFMSRQWDHGVPGVPFWEAALRVAKPGAMMLAFGGTRTHHRLMCAIEDAGWEIRDVLMWVYGSGFPKSLAVDKAIDKMLPRAGMFDTFAIHFAEQRKANGLSQKNVASHFPSKTGGMTGCVWNWENGANVPTLEQWHILQPLLGLSTDWLPLIEREEAEREVIGQTQYTNGGGNAYELRRGEKVHLDYDITSPATNAAKQWAGWGTALKPAWEPIILAMKPVDKTFANNALVHGVAGLNIDQCRIDITDGAKMARKNAPGANGWKNSSGGPNSAALNGEPSGRWPANLLLDEEAAALLDEMSGERKSGARNGPNPNATKSLADAYGGGWKQTGGACEASTGGASRFFYVSKASRRDRSSDGTVNNIHPTCKPTQLMKYLCKLICPPNGTILDPFLGSGSTGVAAVLEGFNFVGIELDAEYLEIARPRIAWAQSQVDKQAQLPLLEAIRCHQ